MTIDSGGRPRALPHVADCAWGSALRVKLHVYETEATSFWGCTIYLCQRYQLFFVLAFGRVDVSSLLRVLLRPACACTTMSTIEDSGMVSAMLMKGKKTPAKDDSASKNCASLSVEKNEEKERSRRSRGDKRKRAEEKAKAAAAEKDGKDERPAVPSAAPAAEAAPAP
eukprot:179582-Prymnesium_polylepis.1